MLAELSIATNHAQELGTCARVFAETAKQAQQPLPDAAFVDWPRIPIKAGATRQVRIQLDGRRIKYELLADLCGLAAPTDLPGVSLRPILDDPTVTLKTAAFSAVQRKVRLKSIFKDITPVEQLNLPRYDGDWLVRRPDAASTFEVKLADDGRSATLVLANGLVRRTFYLGDNLVCFSLRQ
jgi:hypothetical protein